ncbi:MULTISPECIES: inverse autotransporter beta domain-containing protein [Veillonella]|uniref:inverse autotransporter beta domain-containing protein n=1 Tax=Veillonella TaxID=29465 RepID=UPI002588E7DD|nr:inverse autotransporter beta domain-containing protein [Veillonella sp.]MDU4398992.1 inverse autotransporter beta domain-containing protein [Veillonella sp.]MDU5084271.1 inverse autotransporter beta domain-containing protein [Veillonella sp.]
MSKTLMIKAMVLGAVACAFSATGFAADVQNGHGQGIADSTTEVNGAKHEAVRSNWMDRTDIKVGTQSKMGKQISVETLQPLTHYDENSKSVLFVQGGVGKGGQEHKVNYFDGSGGIWYPYDSATGTMETKTKPERHDETKSLGTVGNIGLGYRQLSNHEHAYVGVNVFADRAFSENVNRVSGGLEYVAGLNEVRVNVYRGLGNIKSQSYMVRVPESHLPIPLNGGTANYTVYKSQKVLSGYDINYARTFKNARWARVYIGAYHWNGLGISSYSGGTSPISNLGNSSGWQLGTTLQVTPHVSLDLGYTSDSKYASGAYGFVKYTLGTSKFAWHGGKHSDDTITNARARMLDKVKRNPMMIGKSYEEFWAVVPYDALP